MSPKQWPQADVDAALAYLRREHGRLRPLVVVYCRTSRSHPVIRVFRTRWGPYLWATPVRWSKNRQDGKSIVYNDGLMDLGHPQGMQLIAGCRCGVQAIERVPVWEATAEAMRDGKRRVLRASSPPMFG